MARFADVVLPATIYPPEAGSASVPPFTCSLTFGAVVPIPTWFVVDSTNKAPALTFTSPPSLFNKSVLETPLLRAMRSEEHTSELQSHVNLVCRLLLEKKKKT